MKNKIIPSKQGQIVKLTEPMADDNLAEVYLILEDVSSYTDDETIHVVSLTDLQRNASDPMSAPVLIVAKSELTVVYRQMIQQLM